MTCILLTGSSRGIGAAAKAALEARGARVVGQATRSESVDTVPADFCEPGAPQELWQAALARAGGAIDVLVNNAGLFDPNPIDRSDIGWLDAWEDTLRINLTAAARLSASRCAIGRRGACAAYRPCREPRGARVRRPTGITPRARAGCWRCTRPSPANMRRTESSASRSRPALPIRRWRATISKAVADRACWRTFRSAAWPNPKKLHGSSNSARSTRPPT